MRFLYKNSKTLDFLVIADTFVTDKLAIQLFNFKNILRTP